MASPTGAEPWALVTMSDAESSTSRVGIQRLGDTEALVPDYLRGFSGVLEVIEQWDELSDRLRSENLAQGDRVENPHILMPLRYPRKILCSGPNYTDHLAEMGESGLGDTWSAYFFFKPPTTTLIGPGEPVLVGADWKAARVDWEGELAVVMARGGRDIPASDALGYVAGYLAANDISLRGPHRRDTPAAPFIWDWVASKAADTSLPIGPGLVPSWQVPDPQALQIRTSVNGILKQDGTTANMVLDVATLIADASKQLTLEPGDVILTGTPAGVGASSGTFLAPGDVVEIDIPGVGRLRNSIQQRPAR